MPLKLIDHVQEKIKIDGSHGITLFHFEHEILTNLTLHKHWWPSWILHFAGQWLKIQPGK